MSPVLDKMELVKFLITYHNKIKGEMISRIKLQKALYFLYAFYAGKTALLNLDTSDSAIKFNEDLFKANFEAWVYGPVDSKVYQDFKNDKIDISSFNLDDFLGKLDDFTKGYLEDMSERIFNTSDFGLVDLSHEDISWKSNFDRSCPMLGKVIKNSDIKEEYAKKELNRG